LISLFTLHVLWPFLWIWATLYREDRGWGFNDKSKEEEKNSPSEEIAQQFSLLNQRIELLEKQLQNNQATATTDTEQKIAHDSFSEIESSIIADQEGSK